MKRIILEYSSIPLFKSFNGGNRKPILLFESLSRREHSFLSIILKPQIFIFPEIGRNGRDRMKLDLMNFFTKTPKTPLYIQPFILN